MADEYRPPNPAANTGINRPNITPTPHSSRDTGTTPQPHTARRDTSGLGTGFAVGAIFLVVAGLAYAFYNADTYTAAPPSGTLQPDAPATGTASDPATTGGTATPPAAPDATVPATPVAPDAAPATPPVNN